MSVGFETALREAARLLGGLAVPVLVAVLVAGLFAGILQGATRIRDRSLSVAPRIIAVSIVIVLCGAWSASRVGEFAASMFHAAETAARSAVP